MACPACFRHEAKKQEQRLSVSESLSYLHADELSMTCVFLGPPAILAFAWRALKTTRQLYTLCHAHPQSMHAEIKGTSSYGLSSSPRNLKLHIICANADRSLGPPFQREVARHGHEANVTLLRGFERKLLHGNLAKGRGRNLCSSRAVAEKPYFVRGEFSILEAFQHLLSHSTGATNDPDRVDLRR